MWTEGRIFSVIRMSADGGGVEAAYHEWVRKSLD